MMARLSARMAISAAAASCSIAGAGMRPWARAKSAIHSKPHSTGRTTRLVSRVVSAVSHAYIQRAYCCFSIPLLLYQRRAEAPQPAERQELRDVHFPYYFLNADV